MTRMKCPNCGRALQVPASRQAMHLLCPSCKHTFQSRPAEGIRLPVKSVAIALGAAGVLFLGFLLFHLGVDPAKPPTHGPPAPTGGPGTNPADTSANALPPAKPMSDGPMSPAELFAKASPAVVQILVRDDVHESVGQGSGFFVSPDGLLVTNYHLVKDAVYARVRMDNKATLFVQRIVATAPESDLALLKVAGRGEPLPHLPVAEGDPPRPGTKVLAIGSPQGYTNTLSEGLISGVRSGDGQAVRIQTTAPISQGSSGGPLLTLDGQVVGVTTYYVRDGQNLNFAIPASEVRQLVRDRRNPKPIAGSDTQVSRAAAQGVHEARLAIETGDLDDAYQILDRLRKTQKSDPAVWFWYGCVQSRRGKADEAVEAFRTTVALKPDFAKAQLMLGFSYAHVHRHAEAVAAYKKAIEIDPANAYAYLWLAHSCSALREYAAGIAACDKAIRLDPFGRIGSEAHRLRHALVAARASSQPHPRPRPGPRRQTSHQFDRSSPSSDRISASPP